MNLTSEQEHRLHVQFHGDRVRFEVYLKVLYVIGHILIAMGIVSNLLVCFVMMNGRRKFRSSVANFLITHLAFTDLVFRAVGIIGAIVGAVNKRLLSPLGCKFTIFSQGSCAAVMFFLLAEIALDRFFHIVYPLRSLRLKWPKVKTILLTWALAFVVCSGFLYSATNKRFVRKYHVASINTSKNITRMARGRNKKEIVFDLQTDDCVTGVPELWARKLSVTVYFLSAFLVPLFAMALCYGKILRFFWKRKRIGAINIAVARSKYKATRMLIVVVLMAFISWGPLMFMDTFQSYLQRRIYFWDFPARPLLVCLSFTTSTLNPLIYAFGNSNFRKELKRLFCRARKVVTLTRN